MKKQQSNANGTIADRVTEASSLAGVSGTLATAAQVFGAGSKTGSILAGLSALAGIAAIFRREKGAAQ